MPKELAHILICREAVQKVEGLNPRAARALSDNAGILALGSILCDSAYYDPRGKVTPLSDEIHTARGDISGRFFGALSFLAPPGGAEAYFAFLCGILSHHLADGRMHPFIVYYTGNYKDPDREERRRSQARHRFMEGLIDIWMAKRAGMGDIAGFRLENHVPLERSAVYPYLLAFVSAAGGDLRSGKAEDDAAGILRALNFERRLASLYSGKIARPLFLGLNRLSGGRLSHYAALLYPYDSGIPLKALPAEGYRNPFTGEDVREGLEEIADGIVRDLAGAAAQSYDAFISSGRLFRDEDMHRWFKTEAPGVPAFFDTSSMDRALSEFLGIERG